MRACTLLDGFMRTCLHNVQEATLSDVPVMMTMKEEIPSGKLYVAYKNGTIEVVDEISAEAQRFLTVDSRVSDRTAGEPTQGPVWYAVGNVQYCDGPFVGFLSLFGVDHQCRHCILCLGP